MKAQGTVQVEEQVEGRGRRDRAVSRRCEGVHKPRCNDCNDAGVNDDSNIETARESSDGSQEGHH